MVYFHIVSTLSFLTRAARRQVTSLGMVAAITCCTLGCRPPIVSRPLPSAVVSRKSERLDPALLQQTVGEWKGQAYRIGPGDSLLVAVYGHPELALAPYASGSGMMSSGRSTGLIVDNDGTVQLPLIGTFNVHGRTSAELKDLLEQRLVNFIKDPKVTVQVMHAGSIRYYLLGEFNDPGLKMSDRPLHLLEGLTLGGSVRLQQASLATSYVMRQGRRLPINFRTLIRDGDMSQNVSLMTGDVVVVPDNQSERAYVFGGVDGSNRGGSIPFLNGHLTLMQALAHAGFGFEERASVRLSKTFIIRSEGDRGELFIVNASKIMSGNAADFPLAPGDVIFVPATAIAGWNQALRQLLPTLQTVAGLLQPFVQIKYLSE